MKQIFLIFLIILSGLFINPAYCQDDSADELKNEIGVAISGGNQRAGAGIFYRRHFENGAGRLWAQSEGNGNLDTERNFTGTYSFDVAAGYQIHAPIGDRWTVYYGPDVIFGLSRLTFMEEEPPASITTRTLRYGLRPFMGVSFRFRDRIKISAEARMSIFYNREKTTHYFDQESDSEPATTAVSYLQWDSIPAGALLFSFFF